ncbi:ABC transporter ATP-binding protein [Patescibacteria group bacterium]|nr:ABC transporter ATP-binding protein [Patescibacteria group bacterium]
MTDRVVTFHSVRKLYGSFQALSGLSFSINKGELYGLIGPNGAGKTTAIRVLTGLNRHSSGDVTVLGHQPQDPKLRPLLGYMPQETALYQDLSVEENLRFFGKLYDIPAVELNRRVNDLLAFVDLEKWRSHVITELSGGMRHRASLAAALIPKPRLLVLDEPTVGVDPELRANFWQRFSEMQRDGTTILITTHYMDEAMRCDRVGLINHGQLVIEGAPAQLIHDANVSNLEEVFLKLAKREAPQ